MRKGGNKAKGSEWERATGRMLSLWLTHSERDDIFSRNVLSGGSFTMAEGKGKLSSRMPGDVMAAHPLAFQFLQQYSIECKHLRDIGLLRYLLDPRAMTPLGVIIRQARRQADHIGLDYMVIAKQNQRFPVVFTSAKAGTHMLNAITTRGRRLTLRPMHHWLHSETVFMIRLADMVTRIDPDNFLDKGRE